MSAELTPEQEARRDVAEILKRHGPALRLALAMAQQPAWQPIGTAPKGSLGFLVLGVWSDGSPWWNIGHSTKGGILYGDWSGLTEPTHWMPLPSPPLSARPGESLGVSPEEPSSPSPDQQRIAQLEEGNARLEGALRKLSAAVFGQQLGDEPDVYADYDALTELHRETRDALTKQVKHD